MMGISLGGFNALQVAALQPEPLKAIITLCSTVDRYADDIHYKGGCLLNPQSKLLPHAKASIVSSGRLLFVKDGISVNKIKWIAKKI